MLKNDPPAGTKVRFTRELRKARALDIASLVKPLRKYYKDNPEDKFEVEYRGERMTVQRRDIEEMREQEREMER